MPSRLFILKLRTAGTVFSAAGMGVRKQAAAKPARATTAERTRENEREALGRGELRAGDLMRADAWEHAGRVDLAGSVIIPGANPAVVEEKKNQMINLGTLEFSIVANERDHRDIIQQARDNPTRKEVRVGGTVVAAWRPIAPETRVGPDGAIYIGDTENHRIRKLTRGGNLHWCERLPR